MNSINITNHLQPIWKKLEHFFFETIPRECKRLRTYVRNDIVELPTPKAQRLMKEIKEMLLIDQNAKNSLEYDEKMKILKSIKHDVEQWLRPEIDKFLNSPTKQFKPRETYGNWRNEEE